jgi:hypothetical protein
MVAPGSEPRPLFGIDFSSSPRPRKPITVAHGRRRGDRVELTALATLGSLPEFAGFLRQPGPWLGGFDFPFGLPRELVVTLGWPQRWPEMIRHCAALDRVELRDTFAAFCRARPTGGKFAFRATDGPAGASTSMKWVNPPVAFMLHAGAPLLLTAGVHIPALHDGDRERVALEAYPGLLARAVLGRRSYKNDQKREQTSERAAARAELLRALVAGDHPLGLRLVADAQHAAALVADAAGDQLDAVLALMQTAAVAEAPNYGMPDDVDPLEGWIITAPQSVAERG